MLLNSFTSRTSPSVAIGSMLTKAIRESKDIKQSLNVLFADATQAFDRSWHDSIILNVEVVIPQQLI